MESLKIVLYLVLNVSMAQSKIFETMYKALKHTRIYWVWAPLNILSTPSKIISTPSKYEKKDLFCENLLNLASTKKFRTPSKKNSPPKVFAPPWKFSPGSGLALKVSVVPSDNSGLRTYNKWKSAVSGNFFKILA